MNYEAMGRQIRKYRREKGMTQDVLAKRAKISASFLGHIERGSRKASLETLVSIANILQVGTDALLTDSLECSVFTENGENMSAEKKKLLTEMMRVLEENKGAWSK